jgi:hypothetical protein
MWNYRIIKYPKSYDEDTYGVVECFYNDKGEDCGFTQNPIIVSETIDGLIDVLHMIERDIEKCRNDELLTPDMELASMDDPA